MWFTALFAPIANVFTSWFSSRTAASNAQGVEATAGATMETADDQLGAVVVNATSPRFKEIFICVVLFPFFINFVFPTWAAHIFASMQTIPKDYFGLCTIIIELILGVHVGGTIVDKVTTAMLNHTIVKTNATLTKASIDKQAFYDALSHLKGTTIANEVKSTADEVIDQIDKDK